LISQRGVLKSATPQSNLDQVWQLVADDIEKADHIVVNSEFVKKTFLFCGIPPNKITVIYLGVDDTFAASIPARQRRSSKSAFRFLFAGTFCHRKGVDILLQAIHQLPKYGWTMRLAGSIDPILTDSLATICANFPVEHLGNLTRRELAQAMSETDAFVFPSFAEGSARVIFEAMACGCYIITTENSGSIVEDGVHGRLVTPGDATALAYAMQTAISDASVQNVGGMNAALIAEKYGQDTYGKRLADLYMSLKCG
jgi:glycosyltransferase involved in cell wall biosynthesis